MSDPARTADEPTGSAPELGARTKRVHHNAPSGDADKEETVWALV